MNEAIRTLALNAGITRLCHFAPSRKLVHIASGETGILSSQNLNANERDIFDPTDLARLDGHPNHVCCSIEYPNAWYFEKARQKERLFRDWIVIFFDPKHLWMKGTLFCARNAAAQSGSLLEPGIEGFKKLFDRVPGGRCPPRGARHLPCSPTDDQAEVLVLDRIPFRDISAIAVSSSQQAKLETERLKQAGIGTNQLRWLVAEALYDPRVLAAKIRAGRRPTETLWTPEP